jgi:hypothetical protein
MSRTIKALDLMEQAESNVGKHIILWQLQILRKMEAQRREERQATRQDAPETWVASDGMEYEVAD